MQEFQDGLGPPTENPKSETNSGSETPAKRSEMPAKISRRQFLIGAGKAAAVAGGVLLGLKPFSPAETRAEKGKSGEERAEKFTRETIKRILADGIPVLANPYNFSPKKPDFGKLSSKFGIGEESWRTLQDYIKFPPKTKLPEEMKALGIPDSVYLDLAEMLLFRYKDIYNNPIKQLSLGADPDIKALNRLLRKYAKLTGLPLEVVFTLGWLESALQSFLSGHLRDQPGSPSNGLFNPNVDLCRSSSPVEGKKYLHPQDKWLPTESEALLYTYPQDEELYPTYWNLQKLKDLLGGRIDSSVEKSLKGPIITPIEVRLVRIDAELNTIAGLLHYIQALEALFTEPKLMLLREILAETPNINYFDIAFILYHRGPEVVHQLAELSKTYGKDDLKRLLLKPNSEFAAGFADLANVFAHTRQDRTWENHDFQTGNKKFPESGKRYYCNPGFKKMTLEYIGAQPPLPKNVPTLENPQWTGDFDDDTDEMLLARAIYGEAGGESEEAKIAVAWAIKNRVKDEKKRWGETYHEVILMKRQFSPFNNPDSYIFKKITNPPLDNPLENKVWRKSFQAANKVILEEVPDPTNGANHFYAVTAQRPPWADEKKFTVQIGGTRFYRL